MFLQIGALNKSGEVGFIESIIFILVAIGLLIWTIYMTLAERRITVQYAGKQLSGSNKNNKAHIPFSITGSAVIAIIFCYICTTISSNYWYIFFSRFMDK